jgi:hypothetical protein
LTAPPRDGVALNALAEMIDAVDPHSCGTIGYARWQLAQSAYAARADAFGDDQSLRAKQLLDECWEGHPSPRVKIDACVADRTACRNNARAPTSR